MSILHYFSGDEDKRARFIFNLIAPVYGMIDNAIEQEYVSMTELLDENIPLKNMSVLDVGSGTGAWLAAINRFGLSDACGVDFSEKMVKQAMKNHPEIKFIQGSGENLSMFDDNSFDIVTASFVLHGMKREKRAGVLAEMKRVARKYAVIHDFHKKTSPAIRILEFLERSDYVNFKKGFMEEMKMLFPKTTVIPSENGNGLYVGTII
jgi:ubiquinone/menaquinone biosynthesis C-methylase UbiE